MKISNTGYVTTKIGLLRDIEVKCVFTGETRTRTDGKVEAQFLQISGAGIERKLWILREDIW